MAAASEMGKGQTKAHPGFTAVAAKIGKRSGIKNPAAVLAAATRKASPAAKKSNPRLKRVLPKKK
jgi:hypothetical protein